MSEPLELERSEARRMAAESEAAALRTQLATRADAERVAGEQAALRESLKYGGTIGDLERRLQRLQQLHEEMRGRMDSSFGENGVQANDGVIRGSGDQGSEKGEPLPSKLTYFVEAGVTVRYRVNMRRA